MGNIKHMSHGQLMPVRRQLSSRVVEERPFKQSLLRWGGVASLALMATLPVQGALVQHLDATVVGSVSGSPVTQWADQSGNANDVATSSGSVYYPSTSLSETGLAGLDFGATANSLELFSAAGSDLWLDQSAGNGFCVLVALKVDSIIGDWNDLIGNTTASSAGFGIRCNNAGQLQAYLGGVKVNPATTLVAGDTVILGFNYDAAFGSFSLWDSKSGTSIGGSVAAADFSLASAVNLGKTSSNNRYLDGMVGEVKIFDAVLSSAELQSEYDALYDKWVVAPEPYTPRTNGPPNIVFILADDLGWGDLSCYGHPDMQTPVLDQMASEGIRFENFRVTGVTCCPSRTGFMTGVHPASYPAYPMQHGFADQTTVTELLTENGYTTGHFGKWHIGPVEKVGTYGIDDLQVVGGADDSHDGRDAQVFSSAINFIEENKREPFYLNVWGHISHFEVNPHESLVQDFSSFVLDTNKYTTAWQQMKFSLAQAVIDYWNLPEDVEMAMRNYMGDVYSLDINVGYLLNKLDELGLSENTIVVFSSDQGAAPVFTVQEIKDKSMNPDSAKNMLGYAGPFSGGKHTQLEGGVRSPFIVRWPGQVPAGVVNTDSAISALDWLPTVCSLAGISIDPIALGIQGEDVSDIWYGSARQPNRSLLWRSSAANSGPAMLDGKWKLHRSTRYSGDLELYDLEADPAELYNLAAVETDVVNAMLPIMDAWVSAQPAGYDTSTHHSPAIPTANAGSDQVVEDSDGDGVAAVTLDASASFDSDGYICGYIWRTNGVQVAVADTPAVDLPVGTHNVDVEVTDYYGNVDFDTVVITVNESGGGGGGPGVSFASGESTVAGSVSSGTIADTVSNDDVYEALTEGESGGKPSNRISELEHDWVFSVPGGSTVNFYVEAHHTANSEGDDFVLAYSTDGVNYTDMVTVTKTSDDDTVQWYALPAGISGDVHVRARDTDRTAGNRTLDSLYVDAVFITYE